MAETAVDLCGVTKRFGTFTAVENINLAIREGEFFTLLGASGCGKTTTLRLIAGFELPSDGHILIGGQDVSEVPAYQRPVHTVFQSYALFPHLSIIENVVFPLKVRRLSRDEQRRRARTALEMVQMGSFADRKPSQLSGGQQQRVALARALVNEPKVLLLDEPLGALDLKLRKEMQLELKAMQRRLGITFVFVTHDQEEALTMSDRIALMKGGRIVQLGDPASLYDAPQSVYAAEFIGETNLIPATLSGGALQAMGQSFAAPARLPDGPVTLALRPERILRQLPPRPGDVPGTLREVAFIGTDLRLVYDVPGGQSLAVRVQNRGGPPPETGETAGLSFAPEAMRLFPN